MTDEERREAIEEFLEYADRKCYAFCRQVIGADWTSRVERVSEPELLALMDRYLLERIPR